MRGGIGHEEVMGGRKWVSDRGGQGRNGRVVTKGNGM